MKANQTRSIATLIFAAAIATAAAAPAAQYTAALQFQGQTLGATLDISTRGYSFDVTSPSGVVVTALSVYDADSDGLDGSHAVGLWDASGTLLASATVPAGTSAPLDSSGVFRYVPITPLSLSPGANYVVGALFMLGSVDCQAYNLSGLTTAPGVRFDQARYINNGLYTLSFPTETILQSGLPGGSFDIAAVPEPAPWTWLGLGFPTLLVLLRRKP